LKSRYIVSTSGTVTKNCQESKESFAPFASDLSSARFAIDACSSPRVIPSAEGENLDRACADLYSPVMQQFTGDFVRNRNAEHATKTLTTQKKKIPPPVLARRGHKKKPPKSNLTSIDGSSGYRSISIASSAPPPQVSVFSRNLEYHDTPRVLSGSVPTNISSYPDSPINSSLVDDGINDYRPTRA
jgi:hypothetical protein